MIRQPKMYRQYSTIGVWPLFSWRLCHKCGMEFRREWGWQYIIYRFVNSGMDGACFCGRCFKNQDEVEDYIKNWRPQAPPKRESK